MAGAQDKKFVEGILALLCALWVLSKSVICDRKMTTVYNPGCNIAACRPGYEGAALNVAYVKSEGENDTLHFLISSVGGPSILVLQTLPGTNGTVLIDWDTLEAGFAISDNSAHAITVTEEVRYSFGVAFTQLYEDIDIKDKIKLIPDLNDTEVVSHRLDRLKWAGIVDQSEMATQNAVVLKASLSADNVTTGGFVSFKFTVFNDTDTEQESESTNRSYLLYNNNVTRVEITVESPVPRGLEYGVEMVVLSSDPSSDDAMNSTQITNRGDYVPGAFKITDWVRNTHNRSDEGIFQWKPTCDCRCSLDQTNRTYKYERTYMLMHREDDIIKTVPQLVNNFIYGYYRNTESRPKLANTVRRVAFGSHCTSWDFGIRSSLYQDSPQHAWCSSGGVDPQKREVCHSLCSSPHMTSKQTGRPDKLPMAMDSIVEGYECRFLCHGRHWGCHQFSARNTCRPTDPKGPSIDGLDIAYMCAMTRTGVLHCVTQPRTDCDPGDITPCGCGKVTGLDSSLGGFSGCSEDVEYVDSITLPRGWPTAYEKPKDTGEKLVFDWGEERISKDGVINKAELLCKCLGMSGSCPVKICWRKTQKFRVRGSILLKATRGKLCGPRRVARRKQIKEVCAKIDAERENIRTNAVSLLSEKSRGMECKNHSADADSCAVLCGGRGFLTLRVTENYDCDCRFVWCCRVECQRCKRKVRAHFCK